MQIYCDSSKAKLTRYYRNIVSVLLAAYLLVAIGLFAWLPGFLFHQDASHSVTLQKTDYTVVWTIKHVGDGLQLGGYSPRVTMPDHVLDVPSDEFIKYLSKIVTLEEAVTVFSGYLLLWLFIESFKFFSPRYTSVVPVFFAPTRNSTAILIRSTVLRH